MLSIVQTVYAVVPFSIAFLTQLHILTSFSFVSRLIREQSPETCQNVFADHARETEERRHRSCRGLDVVVGEYEIET